MRSETLPANALDGDLNGSAGGDFSVAFVVNIPTAAGAEFRVNSYTTDFQQIPAVALDDAGDFVIVWNSAGQDGSNDGVYAQRYNAAGTPQGGQFRVNSYTTAFQGRASVLRSTTTAISSSSGRVAGRTAAGRESTPRPRTAPGCPRRRIQGQHIYNK